MQPADAVSIAPDQIAQESPSAEPSIRPAWRWAEAAVLAAAAILFFARLGARALWASEFRWAEIAREMILNHNYFWPTINGHVYYDKPLGSYWLVVAATWLTGGMNEAAARLPSAIAGLLAVALLISLTRRLHNRRTALIAGMILATSFSFVFFSRDADADIETIAGELAALLIYWSNQERPGWWVFGLWILMALTSLTKGLLGFVLPLIVIGIYANLRDGWSSLGHDFSHGALSGRLRRLVARNDWFFNRYTPLAIVIAGLLYYWPFAISHAETGSTKGLYMVYRENVERYFAPFDHVGPIYLYVYVIFALMAPWSVFLPAALLNARRADRESQDQARARRFVLSFFWATFVFFTLSGSRRSYYLLPILPAGAILIANLFERADELAARTVRFLYSAGCLTLVIVVAFSAIALVPPVRFLPHPYSLLPSLPHRLVFVIYLLGAVIAFSYAIRSKRRRSYFLATVVAAWLFMFYFFVFAMPAGDAWRGEKPFAHQVRALIDGDAAQLAFYRVGGPAFYLDLPHPVPSYATRAQLDAAVASRRTRWIILRRRDQDDLGFAATEVSHEATFPWDSRDHQLNALVLLRAASTDPAVEAPQ